MRSLPVILLFVIGICAHSSYAQFKTGNIKTQYPAYSVGNYVVSGNATVNATEQHREYNHQNNYYGNSYNGKFIPAETYQGGEFLPVTRPPVVLDATADFINKTRSQMASGVCYREVPTASLLRDSNARISGNGTTPEMSRIQVCCDGYERNAHVYARCDPICPDDCPHGICTAPNTCVCIPGHIRNHEDKCISTCPLGCGNGVCDGNGLCQCNPGYTLEPSSRQYCVPECNPSCQFGKCVRPNKCDCLDGYRLNAAGGCEPKCDNCENGQCTAPGFCSCNAGYLKVAGLCEPVCALGCTNGRCVAPDTCECKRGYEIDRTGSNCVPHCDMPCLNGVCDGNNSCTCNPGYILDENQRNICKAHCPQGCPNGYCTSPNFCVCRPGFIKSGIKGRQTCMPV